MPSRHPETIMLTLVQDLRYALRQLRKSPGFAFTVILTLALGIGANTAIFSVMNAVLLRMLPVRHPEQLFYLSHQNMPPNTSDTGDAAYTYGINIYNRLREDRSVLSDLIAYVPLSFSKTAVRFGDTPEEIEADEVSGNFFSALGVNMALGEAFSAADEDKHSAVAVISYGYWTRRFNRDPRILGQAIYVNGVPCTLIGIAAPHFHGIESGGLSTDLWMPLQNRPELPAWGIPVSSGESLYGSPNWWNFMLIARLKRGVAVQQARARLNPVFAHAAYETLGNDVPSTQHKLELTMIPAKGLGTASPEYEQPVRVLMSMVALVLVIACVNIVMLLVARNSVREREFCLRLALGAGRWPLFRQLLAESAILVTAGALLGWLFAVQATRLLALWSGLEVDLAPDRAVLIFTLILSVAAALLFGLAPLRKAAGVPVALILRSTSTQTTASRSRVLSGKLLIAAQMALCVVLLCASGLLLRTLRNYQTVDLGMRAESILVFGVHPIGAGSDAEMLSFYQRLTERLRILPGVRGVTVVSNRPGTGWSNNNDLTVDGRDVQNMLRSNNVGPEYFQTLGTPIIAGRDILASDTKDSERVAIVNQTLVDRFLPKTNPLGHTIGGPKHPFTIVGVVRDSKYVAVSEESMPMAWYSYPQAGGIIPMDVALRAQGNPLALLPAIRRVVHDMDPNAPLDKPQILAASFEESYLMPALFARLAVFFGALAALLAAIGLYGTLAYRVNRRTVEIGVRLALGAPRSQLLWMILRDSLALAAIGLAVGLPLAWFASKWMSAMLYQLSAHDPVSFLAAAIGVIAVTISAALIPARRAASVEPMEALRSE
jgi:predicted permease